MKNGKGMVALSVISLLIGASGLGIGIFSYITFDTVQGPQGLPGDDGSDGTDGIDGINGTLDNLVAIWDQLSGTGTSFNLTLSDIQYNRSEYFDLTDSNTKIHLTKAGWYRFSVRCLIQLSTPNNYWGDIHKNDVQVERLWYVIISTGGTFYMCNAIFYTFSDGDDYFNFLLSGGVSFNVYPDPDYNQLTVEFIGEE